MPNLHRLTSPPDAVRVAIQTTVGGLLAYGLGSLINQEAETWSVFSAVFVIQGTVGGTLGSAAFRVIGGLIGVVLGLAAVTVLGQGGWHQTVGIAVGIGVMSLVTGYYPQLSYGLVTVTMMTVAPGFDVLENATTRSAAIMVGTLAGAATTTFLFPRAAARQGRGATAAAIRGCADLIRRSVAALTSGGGADLADDHAAIGSSLAEARTAGQAARRERLLPARRSAMPVHAVDRLWYSLALLDRLTIRRLPDSVRDSLSGRLEALGDAMAGRLEKVAGDVEADRPLSGDTNEAALQAFRDAMNALRAEHRLAGLSVDEAEHLLSLAFAFEEIDRGVRALRDAAG